ncbi:MAG: hypothetical protein KHX82_07450 [Bacteroides fragilis]|nr:hypothetical protein [Bacteroides fragilis]
MFQPIFYIQLYEMKHEDYIDKINSLTTAVNQFKESYSLLKFSLEASEKRNESLQFQVTRLQDIICIFTDEISGLRVEEFNRISLFFCWAYVQAKFKYAEEISKDLDAAWFVEQIGLLYMYISYRNGNNQNAWSGSQRLSDTCFP